MAGRPRISARSRGIVSNASGARLYPETDGFPRTRPSLTTTILTAFVLGCFAGLVPGPYTTMVAGTGLERGFRAAVKLAWTPLVTDVPPLLVTALVLETLSGTALSVLGVAGGVIIGVVGVRFLRRHGPDVSVLERLERGESAPSRESAEGSESGRSRTGEGGRDVREGSGAQSATLGHVVLGTLLSPAPWIFWLVVGSPLALRSWNRSEAEGVLFVVVLFATNIGTATWLAWIASHSRRLLTARWRTWILRVAGTGLLVAGALLVWQAATGNFESLVRQQETVRSVVEEQTR